MAENPKVFVSYSWDSDDHRAWVRDLAERLVSNGVEVRLDQWNLVPGDSLTSFMEVQIAECDYVLIVCTPNYAQRSSARQGGVGYEQQIISGEIASGIQRRKFIPIVRDGILGAGPGTAIPPHLSGIYAIDMRSPDGINAELEGLLRAIYRVPALAAPPLGPKPSFALSPRADSPPTRAARLPSIEFDGWQLVSGVAMNDRHPDTFSIPSAERRSAVIASDFVKLVFEIVAPDEEDEDAVTINGERMWVRVEGTYGPYIWGKLSNDPLDGGEHGLVRGAEVVFLPEHIIDIIDAEQQAKDEAAFWKAQKRADKAKAPKGGRSKAGEPDIANLRPASRGQMKKG